MPTSSTVLSYKQTPDAWQTKFQERLRLPFPFAWIFVSSVLFLIGYAINQYFGEDPALIRLLLINAALIAAIANATIFYEKMLDEVADNFPELLDENRKDTEKWVRKWYQTIFWSKKNILAGLILVNICFVFGAKSSANLFISLPGIAYSYLISFVISFLGGSMFWTMLGVARLMSSLGKDVNIKPSIFDSESSVLRAASSVLWKVSLIASLVYILGVSRYYFCSLQPGKNIILIVSLFGAFIILYFIVPQMNIHKTLAKLKRARLGKLVSQIDNAFDSVTISPTPESINQLRELFNIQEVLNGKKSWSFGTRELLLLLGSVLVPLLLFVVERFVSQGGRP